MPKVFSVAHIDKLDRKHAFNNEWSVLDYLVSFVKLSELLTEDVKYDIFPVCSLVEVRVHMRKGKNQISQVFEIDI